MPARIAAGLWALVMAFFGLHRSKKSPQQIDQLILDSYKSTGRPHQGFSAWEG